MKLANIILLSICLSLFACEKFEHDKDRPCPVVPNASVKQAVKDAFIAKYKSTIVDTWYNKNDAHLVAKFTFNGKTTFASFSNDGNFENEVTEGNNEQGEHEDMDCGCDNDDEQEGQH